MAGISQNLFWFAAGLLSALAAVFILVPWLGGSSGALRAWWARLRWPALAATVLISLAGVALYVHWGAPGQLSVHGTGVDAALPTASAPGTQAAGSMDEVRARLEERLARQGGSAADWDLLAKTYEFLGRPADAERARTLHQVAHEAVAGSVPPATAQPVTPAGAAALSAVPASRAVGASALSAHAQALLRAADAARLARHDRQAQRLYRRLADLGALDAQGWADYADVAASLQGGRLSGEPERLIAAALARDPGNPKALWLQASAQHEAHHYAAAIRTWRTLLRLVPTDSSDARIFSANLAEDQALAGRGDTADAVGADVAAVAVGTSADPRAAGARRATAPGGPVAVLGQVQLSAALRSSVPAGSTLFVFARSLTSPGPPVAVLRAPTGRWPLSFRLDDTQAMVPGRTLSAAGEVAVQARISRSGQALPAAGDLQSAALRVDPRTGTAVQLIIDQVVH
jgi:cytochrome c-type biogenesis protein CcmH/NrfG